MLAVQPIWKGFYKARVRITTEHSKYEDGVENGWWLFRWVDGKWYFSEPDERELGNRLAKEGEHVSVVYWEWDKEYLDRYVAWADAAYAQVAEKLGRTPAKKPRVIFRPIFRTYSADYGPEEAGFFSMAADDEVYVRSPESFGGGRWREGEDQASWVRTVIAHELTHLFHHNAFQSLRSTPLTLAEGLAEHVAGHYRLPVVRYAANNGKLMSAGQLLGLERTNGEVLSGSLIYGQSALLVRYIDEQYGLEAFWALNERATRKGVPNAAVQAVLGVSVDQLNGGYQAFIKDVLASE